MNDDKLIKFMLGETSNEEEIEVKKWIQADRKNEKYYNDFKLIWDASKKFAAVSEVDEEEEWNTFKQRRENRERNREQLVSIQPRFSFLKIAAAILLLTVAGTVFYTLLKKNDKEEIALVTLKSSNEVIIKTLPDGSVITLNKNSVFTYPEKFTGNKREVELVEGEAFFNVTPDRTKPFVVNTDDITVNVVGTSFNVKEEKTKTEVIVETGIVKVSKKETAVRLEAKEKVTVKRTEDIFIKEKNTDQFHNYYRTKLLVAENTPLWRVVEVLNEAYNANIIIERDNLKNLTLSTTFRLEYKLDKILDIIAETLNIKVVRSKDKVILR